MPIAPPPPRVTGAHGMWEGVLVRSTQIKFIAKILRPGGISTLFSPEPPGVLGKVLMPRGGGEDMGSWRGKREGERKEGHVEGCAGGSELPDHCGPAH